MKPLNLILIGRSGSGKGTQAELLIKYLGNLYHVESGSLIRALAELNSDAGIRAKEVLAKGDLIPEVIAYPLWASEICKNVKPEQGMIFDGSPRRLDEAEHLDEVLKFLDRFENTKVLLVDISDQEAAKRLKLRGRDDDHDKAIQNRLDFFRESVMPVVDHYEKLGKLIKINGEQSVEKIHEDIKAALKI